MANYEILTPTGFQDFDGVLRKKTSKLVTVFAGDYHISCTEDHLLLTPDGFQEARALSCRRQSYNKLRG